MIFIILGIITPLFSIVYELYKAWKLDRSECRYIENGDWEKVHECKVSNDPVKSLRNVLIILGISAVCIIIGALIEDGILR